jgi:hypothetical protein
MSPRQPRHDTGYYNLIDLYLHNLKQEKKHMRKIIGLLLFLCSYAVSFGQGGGRWGNEIYTYGQVHQRIQAMKTFRVPFGSTPNINDPETPTRPGGLFYNTTDDRLYSYNGSTWGVVGGLTSLTNGNGTTGGSNFVDLGGSITASINLTPATDGAFDFVLGSSGSRLQYYNISSYEAAHTFDLYNLQSEDGSTGIQYSTGPGGVLNLYHGSSSGNGSVNVSANSVALFAGDGSGSTNTSAIVTQDGLKIENSNVGATTKLNIPNPPSGGAVSTAGFDATGNIVSFTPSAAPTPSLNQTIQVDPLVTEPGILIGNASAYFNAYDPFSQAQVGIQINSGGELIVGEVTGNVFKLRADNLTASTRNHQAPDADGTYGLSVNGIPFNAQGDVTISGGSGSVTSIDATINNGIPPPSPAVVFSGTPITTSGTLSLDFLGSSTDYINGEGTLVAFPSIPAVTPSALSKTDDTNITLTLGGTPSSALLQPVSIAAGWTGTLADGRIASASTWNAKQNALVSGTSIKTVNSSSLLGSGNLAVGDLVAANNLADVTNTGTARTNLGLGTMATQNTGSFLSVGNDLSDLGSASTARSNLGLGSLATQSGVVANLVDKTTSNTYTAGQKQTFRANSTTAGLSFGGGITSNPSSLSGGDFWFRTDDGLLRYYNGTLVRTLVNLEDAQTLTSKTLTSPVINTSISGSAIDNDPALAANSSTLLATQQATKSYVDGKVNGYTLSFQSLSYSPGDGQNNYLSNMPRTAGTTVDQFYVTAPKTGTIKFAEVFTFSGTIGTNEAWSWYVRVGGVDYLIQTLSTTTAGRVFKNSGLSISVTAGDIIQIKSVNPTWATNPATVTIGANVYIE